MRRRVTTVVLVVLVVLLVAAAAVVAARWWQGRDRTDLEEAVSYAPADAERLSWTDWAAIRHDLDSRVDGGSSPSEVRDFLDAAFDHDLTSVSALVESATVLQDRFGFSPANIDWELFSQSSSGAVAIMRLPGGLDPVADHLEAAGFTRPGAGDGVWTGGSELLSGIDAGLTPELQYVALDADHELVLTSDRESYLRRVMDELGGEDRSEDLRAVTAAAGEPLSAAIYAGDRACAALAINQADAREQATAERLIDAAGGADPMRALAMSVQPSGDLRVDMLFASEAQARANAESRATLATGPAPGQGGDFADRFSVKTAQADGRLVTLTLTPRPGSYAFSDLASGPVLFATC